MMIKVIPLTDREIIDNVKKIINIIVPEAEIYFFGSRINKNAKPVSDFDICIKSPQGTSASDFFSIKQQIEKLDTLKTIDLSKYEDLCDNIKETIDNKGVLL
jgi:predicted nucleotidyltransferase